MITDLNDLSELCSKQFSGTVLTPAEVADKIIKLNDAFEIVPSVKFIIAFGEEDESEDLLEDWTEIGRRPLNELPSEISNYKFLVYDIIYNSKANYIVIMMKGDMSEYHK